MFSFGSKVYFSSVHSFVDMARYLLPVENDGSFLLSERLSQEPIENYFGQQRARGGRNENPSLQQCIQNAAAINLQKSQALGPVRGNCSRKRRLFDGKQVATPLRKCKRNN